MPLQRGEAVRGLTRQRTDAIVLRACHAVSRGRLDGLGGTQSGAVPEIPSVLSVRPSIPERLPWALVSLAKACPEPSGRASNGSSERRDGDRMETVHVRMTNSSNLPVHALEVA